MFSLKVVLDVLAPWEASGHGVCDVCPDLQILTLSLSIWGQSTVILLLIQESWFSCSHSVLYSIDNFGRASLPLQNYRILNIDLSLKYSLTTQLPCNSFKSSAESCRGGFDHPFIESLVVVNLELIHTNRTITSTSIRVISSSNISYHIIYLILYLMSH